MDSQPAKRPNSNSTGQVEASLNQANKTVNQADGNLDPKQMRRMLLNRESARRSHLRKQEHMHKLEQQFKDKKEKIAALTPEVAYNKLKRMLLEKENIQIKARLEALEQYQTFQEAESHQLMAGRDWLKMIYTMQQLQASGSGSSSGPEQQYPKMN